MPRVTLSHHLVALERLLQLGTNREVVVLLHPILVVWVDRGRAFHEEICPRDGLRFLAGLPGGLRGHSDAIRNALN